MDDRDVRKQNKKKIEFEKWIDCYRSIGNSLIKCIVVWYVLYFWYVCRIRYVFYIVLLVLHLCYSKPETDLFKPERPAHRVTIALVMIPRKIHEFEYVDFTYSGPFLDILNICVCVCVVCAG